MKLLFGILSVLSLSACAPALFHPDFPENASTVHDSGILLSASENGSPTEISEALKNFYAGTLEKSIPDGCRLKIALDGNVDERYASFWYLGVLLLAPLWPAMPREDDISITLRSELLCENIVAEKAVFVEEEHPRLFWYGPYRNGHVQKQADLIHAKLAARLRQTLERNAPADNTIRSDFY